MIGENIRKYRKAKNMSQDELAEKLDVTRQSISLWENSQTQPSIDNIVALAKLFDVTTDDLLKNEGADEMLPNNEKPPMPENGNSKKKGLILIGIICLIAIVVIAIVLIVVLKNKSFNKNLNNADSTVEMTNGDDSNYDLNNSDETVSSQDDKSDNDAQSNASSDSKNGKSPTASKKSQSTVNNTKQNSNTKKAATVSEKKQSQNTATKTSSASKTAQKTSSTSATKQNATKDLYGYFKNFVIKNGKINGDYCFYSKPANNYGGSADDDFSLFYWGDTEKIEFCLHHVIDDTYSINYYLYIPKTYSGKYDYVTSYYYRDNGESVCEARGTINAADFTKNYPLNCSKYIGSTELQNDFMETSRFGICNALNCLRKFMEVEKLDYSFSDLGFNKF